MKITAAIITFMVFTLLLPGCTAKAGPAAGSQTAAVQRGNLNINILASGNLLTAHEENLAFYSSGTVQEVLVKVGDRVQVGQALAKLDTAPLESSLAQAQINVKQAQFNLENAVAGSTAPDPLNIEIKELQLQNSRDSEAEAQKKLDKATITAPFAGLVTDVNVVAGDQVSANAVGVRIIDPANFQTEVLVNEMEIYDLGIGTPATVQAVALPAYTFPAKISLIAETPTIQSNVVNYKVTILMDPVDPAVFQAQATVRTVPGNTAARVRPSGTGAQTANAQASDNRTFSMPAFTGQQSDNQTASDNRTSMRRPFAGQTPGAAGQTQPGQTATTLPQDFRLREGLTVTVSIIAEQRTDILLVPNKAITSRNGRYYVQVVSADGKTAEKMIQAGITDGQDTEVISGLNEGDQVSTATNVAAQTSTTNSQQRAPTTSIPGVRLPR